MSRCLASLGILGKDGPGNPIRCSSKPFSAGSITYGAANPAGPPRSTQFRLDSKWASNIPKLDFDSDIKSFKHWVMQAEGFWVTVDQKLQKYWTMHLRQVFL